MSPSDSFCNDRDEHCHQSPPTLSVDDDNNNPHITNHGIFTSERQERRRQNGCHLDEKGKKEKYIRNQTINEGEEYKHSLYEPNKGNHRVEADMLDLGKKENFQRDADKNYWRALVDLIPPEDSSGVAAEGPESAKPIDPARMRQMSLRLRQSLLSHTMPSPPKDPKDEAADTY